MIFWLILAASLIMRCVLIRSGGLFFNPDEFRYYRAINFLHHLKSGEVKEALAMFFIYAEHSGYMLVATIPAAVQGVLDAAFGRSPERSMAVAAIILSLFSVGNIALVYGIARRTGRSKREALVAMGLMAASGVMLHTSRHLLPYDVSLFFGLLAIWLVHGRRSLLATFWHGAVCFHGIHELQRLLDIGGAGGGLRGDSVAGGSRAAMENVAGVGRRYVASTDCTDGVGLLHGIFLPAKPEEFLRDDYPGYLV